MQRASVEEYAAALRERYLGSGKLEKAHLLSEFCQVTGYHRKAAIRLLRRSRAPAESTRPPGRPRQYDGAVTTALQQVWGLSGQLGSQRLVDFLPTLLPVLERHRELQLTDEVRTALLSLSPRTVDRRLATVRRQLRPAPQRASAGRARLKAQIPLRTSADWTGAPVGSVQADLVEHRGEQAGGFFLCTLTVVEVTTSWCVCRPVKGKAMGRVAAAFHRIRTELPMAVCAVHTDNGSEFLNDQLFGYCQREGLSFTRGRAYRKNDQAWVEQKNWVAVRQQVGYGRYQSDEAYRLLAQLYRYQALYHNFFQPVRKVIRKERVGNKLRKHFDRAAPPTSACWRPATWTVPPPGSSSGSLPASTPSSCRPGETRPPSNCSTTQNSRPPHVGAGKLPWSSKLGNPCSAATTPASVTPAVSIDERTN